jgi:hypothetical protein
MDHHSKLYLGRILAAQASEWARDLDLVMRTEYSMCVLALAILMPTYDGYRQLQHFLLLRNETFRDVGQHPVGAYRNASRTLEVTATLALSDYLSAKDYLAQEPK